MPHWASAHVYGGSVNFEKLHRRAPIAQSSGED
jgi:hypothetical protein